MLHSQDNYRGYLKLELANRIAENPAYSLRAFAQKLGLSNSFLSEVLQGKKTFSAEAALKVALRLELNEAESRYFSLLAQVEIEKDPEVRSSIELKLRALNPRRNTMDLSLELFRAISDWYHFAILELTFLSGFELTPSSAAQRLGISKLEAETAIERLLKLELLERDPRGKLRKAKGYVVARSPTTNQALSKFHGQLLEKAKAALTSQTPDERMSSSDIVSIDPKYVSEVRKLSDQFTVELLKIADKSKHKSEAYCLGVHFFRLSEKKEK